MSRQNKPRKPPRMVERSRTASHTRSSNPLDKGWDDSSSALAQAFVNFIRILDLRNGSEGGPLKPWRALPRWSPPASHTTSPSRGTGGTAAEMRMVSPEFSGGGIRQLRSPALPKTPLCERSGDCGMVNRPFRKQRFLIHQRPSVETLPVAIDQFIAKWKKAELKERAAAQEHFLDLCHLLGHPTPAEADATGTSFCFERGAAKHGGGDGVADVWKQNFFGWEYKGKRKDLEAAYDQFLRYKDALENPPLLITCDLDRFVIRTNFTYTAPATFEFRLAEMAEPRNIEILRAVFFNPEALKPGKTSQVITQEAAERFAAIAITLLNRIEYAGFAVVYFLTEVPLLLGLVAVYRARWAPAEQLPELPDGAG
jgi:hypothetical protein